MLFFEVETLNITEQLREIAQLFRDYLSVCLIRIGRLVVLCVLVADLFLDRATSLDLVDEP